MLMKKSKDNNLATAYTASDKFRLYAVAEFNL